MDTFKVTVNGENVELSPFLRGFGIQTVQVEEGQVITELPVTTSIHNAKGFVHGGVYATMLDHILSLCCYSVVKCVVVTINLNIQYTANIQEGKLVATAKVIQQGHRIMMGEGEIRDENGNLLAKAMGSFKIIRNP
jgi:uncharacterized protein (TIGR00369 family)